MGESAATAGVPLGGDYWCGSNVAPGEVWGFADTHAHLMAHLAFGGSAFWGNPDGPIEEALAPCTPMHGPAGCSLAGLIEGGPHRVGGYPDFRGWPRFSTRSHQQMYVAWIRRAYLGGLRLLVTHAVHNELLEFLTRGKRSSDRSAIDTQIQATREFVSRHQDFMQIAFSPMEARRIITSNRLAVVLGVEVDSLAECSLGPSASSTEDWFQHLFNVGVRHVFPVHLVDNSVGGAAVYDDRFAVLNRFLRGACFDLRSGSSTAIEYRIGSRAQPLIDLLRHDPFRTRHRRIEGGHANVRGLSPFGRDVVLPVLMRLGIIIDVDHMSEASVRDTLCLAERQAYPVMAGHASFRELAWPKGQTSVPGKLGTEYQRTADEIRRIHRLGGMVAVGLNQNDTRSYAGSAVQNDCAGSVKNWAQAYGYVLDLMQGENVAIGTDMNGLAGAPGPRFGHRAAHALIGDHLRQRLRSEQRSRQRDGVRYSSHKSILGSRVGDHPPLTACDAGAEDSTLTSMASRTMGCCPTFFKTSSIMVLVQPRFPLYFDRPTRTFECGRLSGDKDRNEQGEVAP